MKTKKIAGKLLAVFLLLSCSAYAANNGKTDQTLGMEQNPANSCAEILNDGNYWIKAINKVRYGSPYGTADRVLTTCKKDGFQLISQFVDTDADDFSNSQYVSWGIEYGWTSMNGGSTPNRYNGISALTIDMLDTSGSFGLGTEVIAWQKGAHPDTPLVFVPDMQVCFFEITKDAGKAKAGTEKCLDTTLLNLLPNGRTEYQKLYFPLRTNTGKTGDYPFNQAVLPRPPRGTPASVLATSGDFILTLASFTGGVGSGSTLGTYTDNANCWKSGTGSSIGSAGRFCEVTNNAPAVASFAQAEPYFNGCIWVGMNEDGDNKTERFCFNPAGIGKNELILISDNKSSDGKLFGFRTYARFWAPK